MHLVINHPRNKQLPFCINDFGIVRRTDAAADVTDTAIFNQHVAFTTAAFVDHGGIFYQ